ncbi:Uma2 family endonuclease [Thermosynechococcaceae cyanobacterium BACA0444]|uniref:Uma2 family endonuclease n=1 Tax=Pseudocalidococcus azoricus BACA0444 TaxID=2918990 RepID=A0AAE4FNW8_9CYAN|nr:Uma2 family endonuclease [Pseudocalidococcus azoricus]MDS3859548.1 Uma2 family endonuclease [Pseudocalidococcus azoricus BACA0444]
MIQTVLEPNHLGIAPGQRLNAAEFYQLCMTYPDQSLELTANGELIIVSPVGGIGGAQEASLIGQVWAWNATKKLGQVFSSSTIFRLPNGAHRSPDVAWVKLGRWQTLTEIERQKFPPLCPDFVIELRSPSDRLIVLQEKMQEYLANGCHLAWLIDLQNQQIEIYRPGLACETQSLPTRLEGGELLPGLVMTIN